MNFLNVIQRLFKTLTKEFALSLMFDRILINAFAVCKSSKKYVSTFVMQKSPIQEKKSQEADFFHFCCIKTVKHVIYVKHALVTSFNSRYLHFQTKFILGFLNVNEKVMHCVKVFHIRSFSESFFLSFRLKTENSSVRIRLQG